MFHCLRTKFSLTSVLSVCSVVKTLPFVLCRLFNYSDLLCSI